jgi:hypothetical protein
MTTPSHVLRRVIFFLALLLPVPVLCAGFACAKSSGSGDKQSQDEPKKESSGKSDDLTSARDLQAWLKRLAGQYTFAGFVDLCGNGNTNDQRPVTGKAECFATNKVPVVHCRVNVKWPAAYKENGTPVLGGVSNLAPAEFLFGMEIPTSPMTVGKGPNGYGLVFMTMDSMGEAEWASGELFGDTFYAREACTDIPGECHRIKRITARPDSDEISMQVDVVIDRQRVLRQAFLLHRKPVSGPAQRSAGSAP